MFEAASTGPGGSPVDLTRCSVGQLAGLFERNHRALMQAECQALMLAAAWADAHEVDVDAGDYQPLIERACFVGGDGTPAVSEFCAAELGRCRRRG
ncbi:hypothetical protein [uncultured Friedmanniella sp.]|uniref:hypothetical protein n=1 Tax=uncultured Friedmanniella sp. TaxID=335381 RepID=UPI0035CA00FC